MSGGWAALDPGRQKCGLVRTDASGTELVDLLICSPREAWDWLQHWQQQAPLQKAWCWVIQHHVAALAPPAAISGTSTNPHAQRRPTAAELEPTMAVAVVLQPEAGSTLAGWWSA